MITKSYQPWVKTIFTRVANHGILHHDPTSYNEIGQSGIHTITNDVIDIVLNSKSEAEAYKNIQKFFCEGTVEIK